MLGKAAVHVYFNAYKEREALYTDTVGPQPGSLPNSSKNARHFFFPTHKTGAGT